MPAPTASTLGLLCVTVALATACSLERADLCSGFDFGADDRCVTFHLSGGTGPIDNVQIDVLVTDTQASGYLLTRRTLTPADSSPKGTPVAIGLSFPARYSPDKMRVLTRLGTTPVAYLDTGLNLSRGERTSQDLQLDDVVHDTCFDHVKETYELDVDCSGDSGPCPYCSKGQHCTSEIDCVDAICQIASGASQGVCVAKP